MEIIDGTEVYVKEELAQRTMGNLYHLKQFAESVYDGLEVGGKVQFREMVLTMQEDINNIIKENPDIFNR